MYVHEVAWNIYVLNYTIYGWTGADQFTEAAARTDYLLCLVATDMEMQDFGPAIVTNLTSFPAFLEIMRSNNLKDLGAVASNYGGIDGDYSCKENSDAKPSRIDYIIANEAAADLVQTVNVDHNSLLPAHHIIQVTFHGQTPHETSNMVNMPKGIHDIVM